MLTFALAGDLQMSYRILSWSIDHFYKGDGEFSYQKGRLWDKNFTLLHWCNGWLARGLSTYLLMAAKDT